MGEDFETPVAEAFARWLEEDGWTVTRSRPGRDEADLDAVRDGERLIAEVKGRSPKDRGAALDIAYGQILRRMHDKHKPSVRYAIVVPEHSLPAAQRVGARVGGRLRIELFVVDDNDHVSSVNR